MTRMCTHLGAEISDNGADAVAQAGNGHALGDAPQQGQRVEVAPDVVQQRSWEGQR